MPDLLPCGLLRLARVAVAGLRALDVAVLAVLAEGHAEQRVHQRTRLRPKAVSTLHRTWARACVARVQCGMLGREHFEFGSRWRCQPDAQRVQLTSHLGSGSQGAIPRQTQIM